MWARLLLSLFLPAAAHLAHATHSAAGYYANTTPLNGPHGSDSAACIAAQGEYLAQQMAMGAPPQNLIQTFSHMDKNVCMWQTVAAGIGAFGTADLHGSAFYPATPYSPGFNAGCCNTPQLVGGPINPAVGNKYLAEEDYAAEGPFGLSFVRYYNSRTINGDVGFSRGWTHTYSRLLFPDGSNMIAMRETGTTVRFTSSGGAYVPDGMTCLRLERITSPSLGWKLTNDRDEVEIYDDPGKLLSITDRAGLTHTLGYTSGKLTSVTDPYGRTLTFTRGAASRIQSIATPSGTISYAFTNAGITANLTGVTYPGPATRTYLYENAAFVNHLTGITDERGRRFSTYRYNAFAWADLTELAGGANKVTVVHDVSNTTRSVTVTQHVSPTQSAQRTYVYETLEGAGRLTGVTSQAGEPCPDCGPKSRTNDANGNVASQVDWNGNRTDYTYDLTRNLETSRTEALTSAGATTPQTRTISTQWHAAFRLPTGIAEPLRITTFAYDADGTTCGARGALCSRSIQATSDTNGSQGFSATPVGTPRTWAYTYNSNGSVLTENGPRTDVSDVTTFAYYANNAACPTTNGGHATGCRGQVHTITNALSQITSILAYDSYGRPAHIVDPNGLVIALTYNARGNPLTRTVGGETTTYQYDLAEQLTRMTLPDGSFLAYTYDDAHRLIAIEDNLGNKVSYTLDFMGNRTLEEVRDPANALVQTRSRVYSSINRLFRELGASSQTTEYSYDDQGNVLTVKDPLNRVTTSQYDALNRLKQITSPVPISAVTQFAYDGIDQLVSVTDPRGLATTYTVNGLGDLTQLSSPDTGATASTYDAAGNLLTQTDAKSQITTYAYDALNRVSSITFHDGSKQLYSYDSGTNGLGRLTGISELDASKTTIAQIAYGYDAQGRVRSETRTVNGVAYATAYRYDSFGRLDRVTYPSGRIVDYAFDAAGRVSAVTTTPSGGAVQTIAASVTYHPFGGVKSFTFGNGQTYARSYDQDGRSASYTLGGTSFTLGYDAASRITAIGANTYGYDALDRLTSATLSATAFGYTYDSVGNRLTKTTGSQTDTYTYETTSNRIATLTPASGPARTFALDPNGSTTSDGINNYTYDPRGRLVRAVGSFATDYQVNALGQRVRKTNSTGDTVFHYDTAGRLIAENTAAGVLKREYLYLGDIPLTVVVQP